MLAILFQPGFVYVVTSDISWTNDSLANDMLSFQED